MKQHQNIKNFTFNVILPALRSLCVGGIFAFLFINIVGSQIISPIYFRLINNDKYSVISFLQKIKILPEYQNILDMNNNIYGNSVKKEIMKQENKKKGLINNLEQQLTINPKARDVLYSLYKLYLIEGNNLQAQKFLEQVNAIDPGFILNIKN